MTRSGASPNTIICRLCESESRWHLKPFSSRHCLPHIWQYQRSFCRPLDLMRLDICEHNRCRQRQSAADMPQVRWRSIGWCGKVDSPLSG